MCRSFILMIMLVGLAACQSTPQPPLAETFPTATPALAPSAVATVVAEPTVEYVISTMPLCPGLASIQPYKFAWPNVEAATEKLADYNWGYYRCSLAQADLAKLIRQEMPKPPYLWDEVNWVEQPEGTLGVFFQRVRQVWIYIWMLRTPDGATSNMVIARGNPGMPQSWECRLWPPAGLAFSSPLSMGSERSKGGGL